MKSECIDQNHKPRPEVEIAASRKAGKSETIVAITGANSGIGLALAKECARQGVTVVMFCRDSVRGAQALQQIKKDVQGCAKVELVLCDISSRESTIAAALEFRKQFEHLDVLFCNAGLMRHVGYRWWLLLRCYTPERLKHFVETSRMTPLGESFLVQKEDRILNVLPETITACVAGHSVLIDALATTLSQGKGRIVWTGSRAACPKGLTWGLAPDGITIWPQVTNDDFYGVAKYLTDAMNKALNEIFSSKDETKHLKSFVGCPGLVVTKTAPDLVMRLCPIIWILALIFPCWRVDPRRGAEVLLRLAAAETLTPGKYSMCGDKLLPTVRGMHEITSENLSKARMFFESGPKIIIQS